MFFIALNLRPSHQIIEYLCPLALPDKYLLVISLFNQMHDLEWRLSNFH